MKKTIFSAAAALLCAASAQGHVWDELATLARPNAEGTFDLERYNFIQPTTYTNAIFLDFNNDGLLDLLVMGQGGDWNIPSSQKFVLLYRNLGPAEDYRFERVPDTGLRQACDEGYFNPVSAGDFNHDGYTDLLMMTNDGTRNVELYLNDRGTGRFTKAPLDFAGVSNGSVMFGDIDGDGWLDIEYTGSDDATPAALKLYRNLGDGTVQDISADGVTGASAGQSSLGDLDGDGMLDIVSFGTGGDGGKVANVYYNAYPSWRSVKGSDCGLLAASRANPLVADFNGDGFMDIVANGEAAAGGYRTRIYYGSHDGNFTLDTAYPVIAVNQDGGINMGDWNGDGNMDLIVGGYLGSNDGDIPRYSAPLRVYENRPADAGNTRPDAPASVKADFADGKIIIEWTDGSDSESPVAALRYNIYVKNETTGELYTMIPANIATGQLKVGTDLQTSLSSRVKRYEMTPFGSGDYTVGVQTLDQSYAPSRFATTRIEGVTHSAISETLADDSDIRVSLDGLDLTVDTASVAAVKVYTPDGRLAASGSAPTILSLPAAGLYLVSVTTPSASKSMKIAAR